MLLERIASVKEVNHIVMSEKVVVKTNTSVSETMVMLSDKFEYD